MMHFGRILIAGSIVVATVSTFRSGETPDPRALIEQAIEAMGGVEALTKHNAATWDEKGTYYGMGDKGVPFAGKYAVQWPHQFRMEIEGAFVLVINGDKGWVKSGGKTVDMDKKQLDVMVHNHKAGYMSTLLPLKDKAFTLTYVGEEKVYDRPALAVKASRAGYPDVKLVFDKSSGLPMKFEFRTKSPEQEYKEVTNLNLFKNYKRVEGIRTPTTVHIHQDGKPFVEADIVELKAVGKLDDSVFAKP